MGESSQRHIPFKMHATNAITKWRQATFWTKEPETIQWIRSFQNSYEKIAVYREPVFVDVGANVGIYSLYAARLYPHMRIIAIEPDQNNYFELIKNISLNGFKNILPMNMAIGAYNKASNWRNSSYLAGNSGGKLINGDGLPILSITLDYLEQISKIDFLKIDIDGAEYDAIFGMESVMGKTTSMLIEMDTTDQRYPTVLEYIQNGGYVLDCEINNLANHSRTRRKKEGIKVENVVFKRSEC